MKFNENFFIIDDTDELSKFKKSIKELSSINRIKILFCLLVLLFYLQLLLAIQKDFIRTGKKKFYDLFYNIKQNEINSKYNNSCFPTGENIYWKNQTNLELEKVKKEVNNSKLLRISFKNKTHFFKNENPKISLIITIYNQDYFIKTMYSYILQQEFKDIEIIFVDDASTDNSSLIIKELMKLDKRIIYLRNPSNKKQYYSINIGVLKSKGEYILSIDPDDLLINNILIKAYETAKLYNLDILQFYMLLGKTLWKKVKYKGGIICENKNIRNIFYHGLTRNLPDKLIKRTIFLKSINFMSKELYNMDYHIHTDDTIFFGIIHFANSYGFLEQIGYYYNIDPNRFKNHSKLKSKSLIANENLRSLFNIMKYFILKSDNNTIEKNYIPYKFFEKKVKGYIKEIIKYINRDFKFYIEVFNLYLNCPFFTKDKKNEINRYKVIFLNQQKVINNLNIS